ncbi:hypothetical protein ONZ51_g11018 [Trametes cubensis]|uniref:Uncharacterized protein n=1 Tax=Trametes cubensis TaxID=1111947 RepID=A0AAD7TIY2_9APHY|nr:hypothetical protein ONZ51_g11018 [Trametes cubensis]
MRVRLWFAVLPVSRKANTADVLPADSDTSSQLGHETHLTALSFPEEVLSSEASADSRTQPGVTFSGSGSFG